MTIQGYTSGIRLKRKNHNIRIENNHFLLGTAAKGIHRKTNGVDDNPLHYSDSLFVINNVFENAQTGIYIFNGFQTYYQYGEFINNEFINVNNGIDISYFGREYNNSGTFIGTNGGVKILNNKIVANQNSIGFTGIKLTYLADSVLVSNNVVIAKTNTIYNIIGLHESNLQGSASKPKAQVWRNNLVELIAPNSASVQGIYFQNGSYQNIIHNSFLIKGKKDSVAYSLAFGFGGTAFNILNNDFVNLTEGNDSYHINTHPTNNPTSTIIGLNYNNFYGLGDNFAKWVSVDHSTLAMHQDSTGFNMNSTEIFSGFAVENNLTGLLCANLVGLGTPVNYVTDDYNGAIRSAVTPTIGAIETIGVINPIITTNASFTSACGDVINDTLTASSSYINGYYEWTNDSVFSLDNPTVINQTGTPSVETYYVSWSAGACMSNMDSITIENKAVPTPTISNIGYDLSCDITGTNYQWLLNDTIISGATAQNYTAVSNGDYTIEVTGPNGCVGESNIITIHTVGINSIRNNIQPVVYPNPTTGVLYINNNNIQVTSIDVLDITGKTVQSFLNTKKVVDLSHLQSGIYFLKINNSVTKIILE